MKLLHLVLAVALAVFSAVSFAQAIDINTATAAELGSWAAIEEPHTVVAELLREGILDRGEGLRAGEGGRRDGVDVRGIRSTHLHAGQRRRNA